MADVSIRLRNGDVLDVETDAIAVQYPQRLHGLIDRVVRLCSAAKRPVLLPQPGAVRLLEAVAGITARRILIVGVAPVQAYDYRDLRSFAKRAVTHLASVPGIHRVALPVYGPPGYRLDEVKAFEAEVGGVLDGMRETPSSSTLNAIALIERDIACAERLTSVLSDMMTPGSGVMQAGAPGSGPSVEAGARPLRNPPDPQHRSTLFLCYRRQDTEDAAGRLYDRLVAAFGADRVFMDIDSVPLGIDFVDHVTEQISRCSAVIVMIGRQWLTVKDKKRRRRLDSEDDLVRAEIRAALQQKIPVIPVVVQSGSMPDPDDLPEDIRPLARRNGIYLRSAQWRDGVDRLLRELDGLIEGRNPP